MPTQRRYRHFLPSRKHHYMPKSNQDVNLSLTNSTSNLETCLLQQQTDEEITYSGFWGVGPANMDGDWSLAVDIMFSSNFTEIGTPIPCANSCYTNVNGIPGCESLKDLGLPAFGSVTQQRVCDMQWGDLDDAYNVLRICAAKLVGSKEMIAAYEMQSKTQNACSVTACMGEDATAPSTSNNDPTTADSLPSSTSSSSPTSNSNRVVWSSSCILVLVAAISGATM